MFIELPNPESFVEPWHLPLAERQRLLIQAKTKVAYFYEEPNNSSFRYRAFNMCEAINETAKEHGISASYFFLCDHEWFTWLSRTADLLIICRSRQSERLSEIIQLFKDQGKTILFDVDDLVFEPSFSQQLILAMGQDANSGEAWDYWHSYTSRIRHTALQCDGTITTNAYLNRIARRSLSKPGAVVSNFMNNAQLSISKSIISSKLRSNFRRNNRLTIGYFSGSPSHQKDFGVAVQALRSLLIARPETELIIAGYIHLDERLSDFQDRIRYEPFRDYVNLQLLAGCCEISIAPLVYSTFTNCKSELKYFESAATGSICVATPSFTFKTAISPGITGYVAKAHEWLSTLTSIADAPEAIARIATQASQSALQSYSPASHLESILRALDLQASLTF